MALTNTPLHTIEEYRAKINAANSPTQMLTIPAGFLEWMVNDAEHLNKLNAFAMSYKCDDAEHMCMLYAATKGTHEV